MLLTKKSQLTGVEHTIEIPVTPYTLAEWDDMKGQRHIQDHFPELTADQREFILTGITATEWEDAFGGDDE